VKLKSLPLALNSENAAHTNSGDSQQNYLHQFNAYLAHSKAILSYMIVL
jgi:hypothetical protein